MIQRRLTWRNERSLYKIKDAFGKDVVSIFAPEFPCTVYDMKKWWSDSWDSLEYGQAYDFSKSFFQQFKELLSRVPLAALFNKNAVNSDYCNHTEDMKNSYLAFGSIFGENIFYSKGAISSKDSMDMLFGDKNERTYETISNEQCYNVVFSKNCTSCTDSMFIRDCHGCSSCFGCVNLRNKSYYIFNEPYSKEEYEKTILGFDLSSFKNLEAMKQKFAEFSFQSPSKYANLVNSPGSTGDGLYDCKNCKWCFDVTNNVENCKYIANAGYNLKDSYHGYGVGIGELLYEIIDTGIGGSKMFAAIGCRSGTNVRYAFNCHGSSSLFGCIGIRNKQYCVLNKQYSKEEYEALIPKIIDQMNDVPYRDAQGREYHYGEFFPI
ncbi:MAG: hypothetical protein HY001_04515, partial [Candidatus Portnoybacteria bacterium]|nr:hypothetical protein [Candidatus Portnoybacteria bacterium]